MDGRNPHLLGWDANRSKPNHRLPAPRSLLQNFDGHNDGFAGPPPARRMKFDDPNGSTELSSNIDPYGQNPSRRSLLQAPPSLIQAPPSLLQAPPSLLQAPPSLLPSPADVVCEILILGNHERIYAESVKKRLLEHGIVSQIRFVVSSDTNFLLAIQDAAYRSLFFACLITEQNVLHQSITVHILQGVHQEHRNMPLSAAVELIVKNFERLKAGGDNESFKSGSVATETLFAPPGDNIKYLLNLAIDKKFLAVGEMDTILDYFEERRDKLAKAKGMKPRRVPKRPLLPEPPATVAPPENEDVTEKQVRDSVQSRLQERIFRLLRGETVEETSLGVLTSSIPRAPAIGENDLDNDDATIAQVLEILTSNPILKQLVGIPSSPIDTPTTELEVHHSNVQSMQSPKYKEFGPVLPASSLYFKPRPLLRPPSLWPPPYP